MSIFITPSSEIDEAYFGGYVLTIKVLSLEH